MEMKTTHLWPCTLLSNPSPSEYLNKTKIQIQIEKMMVGSLNNVHSLHNSVMKNWEEFKTCLALRFVSSIFHRIKILPD